VCSDRRVLWGLEVMAITIFFRRLRRKQEMELVQIREPSFPILPWRWRHDLAAEAVPYTWLYPSYWHQWSSGRGPRPSSNKHSSHPISVRGGGKWTNGRKPYESNIFTIGHRTITIAMLILQFQNRRELEGLKAWLTPSIDGGTSWEECLYSIILFVIYP
jgi:hypothetical protein